MQGLKRSVSAGGDIVDHYCKHFIMSYFSGVETRKKWTVATAYIQVRIILSIAKLQLYCTLWPVGYSSLTAPEADNRALMVVSTQGTISTHWFVICLPAFPDEKLIKPFS